MAEEIWNPSPLTGEEGDADGKGIRPEEDGKGPPSYGRGGSVPAVDSHGLGRIQWFPGHIAKAMRKTEEDLKLCDGVLYVLDARAPYACLNHKMKKLFGEKPVVYLINKKDLVEPSVLSSVVAGFAARGMTAIAVNGQNARDGERIKEACRLAMKSKIERNEKKGIRKTLRFLVAGIPNTGKSTVINTLSGVKKAATGDKAGVTRANQWIRLGEFDLLDTPGTTPPAFENQTYARHLAYIGALSDDVLDFGTLALCLISELKILYPGNLCAKYGLSSEEKEDLVLFEEICASRGCLLRGGDYDYERGARALFDDLRKGRIGKICFEKKP